MTNRAEPNTADDQLTGALEHELTLFTRKAFWRFWTTRYPEVIGLDQTTYPYLAVISARPGLTVGELARMFNVDKSTASRHVAKLTSAELARVVDNPPNARTQPLQATEEGRRRVAIVQADRAAWLHGVLADWPEQDRRDLARLVARLNADLDAREQRTRGR
ncbi:MarR family winged helix-turn-helix transcriptional regulator [Crossiella sp. SN42]|uniref:MarR family winged helix-turn-helix transcriptional regulator n=1 Tax=Crossiella sp. SN42 TaxID=2944808 RepID=UPI00207D225B|nr:MarR family winged helix-turn-helix transcriptional regulator [Crossiella sp. SN42]MCO1576560.1 MarR family winged helix-turn-helix transcriptional regulator [Crossiella sp. SN42]